jgi:hypothetical protein
MSESIINYIIRSSLSLVLLYLFFIFFLGKDRMHKFNRFYLLTSLIFSFVVPLLTLTVLIPSFQVTNSFDVSNFQNSYIQLQTLTLQQESQFNFGRLIPYLYFSISSLLLIRFLFNLIRLQISKSIHPSIKFEGYKIVLINELVLPYSFLSTIYVNSVEYKEGRIPKELLSHEITHIAQRHSLDIIFIELLKVFFWFNPLLFFFKKLIMLNHEYLADDAVTKLNNNFNSYIDILLNIAFRNNNSYLASSFNYSFTKKRLLMMTKNNFSKTAIFKKIAVIPLFLALGLLVINAQDTKPVPTNAPPPPPPHPFGYNMWWTPILAHHNITPNPSKCWYSKNLYETGDQYSRENNTVTLKEAFILSKSVDNLYRIITAKSAIHDINNNTIKVKGAKIVTYKQENDGDKLIQTEWYKDLSFRIVDDIIAPPPPPPPASTKN